MSDYLVIYEREHSGGWGAYIPDLPGVVALGASRGQVEARIKEALALYAAEQRAEGRDLPAPSHQAGFAQA